MDLALVGRGPIQDDGLATAIVVGDHELPVRQMTVDGWKQREQLVAGVQRICETATAMRDFKDKANALPCFRRLAHRNAPA